jgi:hypothetical protein
VVNLPMRGSSAYGDAAVGCAGGEQRGEKEMTMPSSTLAAKTRRSRVTAAACSCHREQCMSTYAKAARDGGGR